MATYSSILVWRLQWTEEPAGLQSIVMHRIKHNSFFRFSILVKGNAKECSNYRTIALISHASKVIFKILQGRLQQYMNRELPDVQVGFRKGRRTRDQIANICWIIEKARVPEKHLSLLY